MNNKVKAGLYTAGIVIGIVVIIYLIVSYPLVLLFLPGAIIVIAAIVGIYQGILKELNKNH